MTCRCEVNMAAREEDCGSRIAYTRCGKPAAGLVHLTDSDREYYACEKHIAEVASDGGLEVHRFDEAR